MIEPGRKVLLFPVEIITRELDFRLVLASRCAHAGNQVFIGNHTDIYELGRRLRHGLYVGKNLLNTSPRRLTECYEHLKANDFRVIFLHEEGAVFSGQHDDWRSELLKKFDPRWMRPEDHICTWGQAQAELYRELHPAGAANLHVTGHPRFHLGSPPYREIYQREVAELQARFGPRIILLNSNFTRSNCATGADYFFKLYGVKPEDQAARTYYFNNYCYSQTRLIAFLRLINRLSDEFPDHQIILRPHPSESSDIYETMLGYVPRVKLVREGSLMAWLLAAEVLIHSGCTTGMEAVMAGLKVINFHPLSEATYDCSLPNKMGLPCPTEDHVVRALREILAGRVATCISPEAAAELYSLMENARPDVDAFDRLARLIGEVEAAMPPTEVTGSLTRFPLLGQREKLRRVLRQAGLGLNSQRPSHLRNKFPGLIPQELDGRLAAIARVTGRPVRATYHSSKLMSVIADGTPSGAS